MNIKQIYQVLDSACMMKQLYWFGKLKINMCPFCKYKEEKFFPSPKVLRELGQVETGKLLPKKQPKS